MTKPVTITIDEAQGAVWLDSGIKVHINNIDDPICDSKADLVGLLACKYIAGLMRRPYEELREMKLRELECDQ